MERIKNARGNSPSWLTPDELEQADIHQISEDTLLKIFKESFYRFDMMVICSLGSHLITIESCDDYIDPQDFIKDFCQPWHEHLEKIVFTRKSKATREGKLWT